MNNDGNAAAALNSALRSRKFEQRNVVALIGCSNCTDIITSFLTEVRFHHHQFEFGLRSR
jgi:hypothetical protein